ncbi:MAG: hypothetical protein ED555_11320 [Allomuricauda sp.]|nr:MAG: hypothetical protein ED555_11320 [Allomuricauda sp.]
MKPIPFHLILSLFILLSQGTLAQTPQFNTEKDLLLAQFDCKTDVDDLHTVAALATLMRTEAYQDIAYFAVAGAYGVQEGLYVPPNALFELAFPNRWADAHHHQKDAINTVLKKVLAILDTGGAVWVAEAGQSDFSARWIAALAKLKPNVNLKERIHVVQHSNWNEEVTDQKLLAYVKATVNYHKIPDGNAVGNGTPGFRSDAPIAWEDYLAGDASRLAIWQKAVALGNQYNGKEGRYLNASIAAGGLDFSDLSETCYILDLSHLKDANAFFNLVK